MDVKNVSRMVPMSTERERAYIRFGLLNSIFSGFPNAFRFLPLAYRSRNRAAWSRSDSSRMSWLRVVDMFVQRLDMLVVKGTVWARYINKRFALRSVSYSIGSTAERYELFL